LQTVGSADLSGSVSFSMSGFINPISTAPKTGFLAQTLDSNAGVINEMQTTFSAPDPCDFDMPIEPSDLNSYLGSGLFADGSAIIDKTS